MTRLAYLLALAFAACAGSGTAEVQYASGVTVSSPELVAVDTGVYTLADSDEPVFYTDNSYWLYRDNRWYRSNRYDRGWVYVREPSPRVRRIQSPTAYVHYRSSRQEARNTPRPAPAWRDDRVYQPMEPERAPTPYPRPPADQIEHDADHDGARDVRVPPPRDRRHPLHDEKRDDPERDD